LSYDKDFLFYTITFHYLNSKFFLHH